MSIYPSLALDSEWMFAAELKSNAVEPVLTDWSLAPVEAWVISATGECQGGNI